MMVSNEKAIRVSLISGRETPNFSLAALGGRGGFAGFWPVAAASKGIEDLNLHVYLYKKN